MDTDCTFEGEEEAFTPFPFSLELPTLVNPPDLVLPPAPPLPPLPTSFSVIPRDFPQEVQLVAFLLRFDMQNGHRAIVYNSLVRMFFLFRLFGDSPFDQPL